MEAELCVFGATFGLLSGRFALAEGNSGGQVGDLLADLGEFGLIGGLGVAHLGSERMPRFGQFRLIRIRHIRGGMLAHWEIGIGGLRVGFGDRRGRLDGLVVWILWILRARLVLLWFLGVVLVLLLLFFFGFGIEDEGGVSS